MTGPLIPVRVGARVVTKREGPDMRCVLRSGRRQPIEGIVVHLVGQSVDIVTPVGPDHDLQWHHNIPLKSIDQAETDPPLKYFVKDTAVRLLMDDRLQDVIALLQTIVPKPRAHLTQQEAV